MKRRAVFLDLNGTLVLPIIVQSPSELKLIDNASAAVATLSDAGFVCPVVTIQSRIGKGLFSLEDFHVWFRSFAVELGALAEQSLELLYTGGVLVSHRSRRPGSLAAIAGEA